MVEISLNYELLGKRIRDARIAAGLSQEELAEKAGCSSQHISHTEKNNTKISLPTLVNIANALNTSLDKLLIDNIKEVKPHLLDEAQVVFSDCDSDEIYVMLEAAKAVKKSLRTRKLKRTE